MAQQPGVMDQLGALRNAGIQLCASVSAAAQLGFLCASIRSVCRKRTVAPSCALCALQKAHCCARFVPYGITIWGIEFVVLGVRDLAKILFF